MLIQDFLFYGNVNHRTIPVKSTSQDFSLPKFEYRKNL